MNKFVHQVISTSSYPQLVNRVLHNQFLTKEEFEKAHARNTANGFIWDERISRYVHPEDKLTETDSCVWVNGIRYFKITAKRKGSSKKLKLWEESKEGQ